MENVGTTSMTSVKFNSRGGVQDKPKKHQPAHSTKYGSQKALRVGPLWDK
jgi:hypothetical protein